MREEVTLSSLSLSTSRYNLNLSLIITYSLSIIFGTFSISQKFYLLCHLIIEVECIYSWSCDSDKPPHESVESLAYLIDSFHGFTLCTLILGVYLFLNIYGIVIFLLSRIVRDDL